MGAVVSTAKKVARDVVKAVTNVVTSVVNFVREQPLLTAGIIIAAGAAIIGAPSAVRAAISFIGANPGAALGIGVAAVGAAAVGGGVVGNIIRGAYDERRVQEAEQNANNAVNGQNEAVARVRQLNAENAALVQNDIVRQGEIVGLREENRELQRDRAQAAPRQAHAAPAPDGPKDVPPPPAGRPESPPPTP